jgi:hypothetical protein
VSLLAPQEGVPASRRRRDDTCLPLSSFSVPLDPIISLAVALAEAPGACACVLGAGVSFDAGVPTASDIFQDGLQRLYRLENETEETPNGEQLATWLLEREYGDMGYSSLLDLIAPDAATRRELLADYFKGVKPGPAHERLADLAASGALRVFVTTNFDRLLERALEARGIEPVVVSDDAGLARAPRREHAQVFILKAHGDYLQETIRNTPSELAELEPGLTAELRAIVDHYGLLVVGWSGSDPALAEIIRGRTSRYGAWWLSRSEHPSEPAPALIEAIGARLMIRAGAAEFLGELERRLSVYRAHESGDDPGSVYDQVLALVKQEDEVDLDQMLRRERFVFESALDTIRVEFANANAGERVLEGWQRLQLATDRRLASLIVLALYRPNLLEQEIRGHVAWASSAQPRDGLNTWVQVWRFPFFIIGMAIGGLAVRLERYASIRPVALSSWSDPNGYKEPFLGHPGELGDFVARRLGPEPPEGKTWLFPTWQWLEQDLRDKDWLTERCPEWLRREGEPHRALIEFALLLNIANGVGDGQLIAWWSLDGTVPLRYAQRLSRDATTRRMIAETALDMPLETFDQSAPETLRKSHGLGMFPDTDRVAAALEQETTD